MEDTTTLPVTKCYCNLYNLPVSQIILITMHCWQSYTLTIEGKGMNCSISQWRINAFKPLKLESTYSNPRRTTFTIIYPRQCFSIVSELWMLLFWIMYFLRVFFINIYIYMLISHLISMRFTLDVIKTCIEHLSDRRLKYSLAHTCSNITYQSISTDR